MTLSIFLSAIFALTYPIIGGLISRFHGGGFVEYWQPKFVKNSLWAFVAITPVAFLLFWYGVHLNLEFLNIFGLSDLIYSIVLNLIIFGLFLMCLTGKATGTGGGLDYGRSPKEPFNGRTLEKTEYLIYPWLFNLVSRRTYDGVLNSLIGISAISGAIVGLILMNPLFAIPVFIAGACRWLAQHIGWSIYPEGKTTNNTVKENFNEATELMEFLTGYFAILSISIVSILLFTVFMLAGIFSL